MEKQVYTVAEVAEIMGVSRNVAYKACHNNEIHSIRLGKRLVIPKVAFDRQMEKTYELQPNKRSEAIGR